MSKHGFFLRGRRPERQAPLAGPAAPVDPPMSVFEVRRWRPAALAVSVLFVASLLEGGVAAAAPVPVVAAKPVAQVKQAADVASARVAARLGGHRVEALSERTETSTTWVNADGSLTSEVGAGPVRFKRAGVWADIDVDLVAADGEVVPRAHPNNLRLSGGGGVKAGSLEATLEAAERPLVSLGSDDSLVSLGWL